MECSSNASDVGPDARARMKGVALRYLPLDALRPTCATRVRTAKRGKASRTILRTTVGADHRAAVDAHGSSGHLTLEVARMIAAGSRRRAGIEHISSHRFDCDAPASLLLPVRLR